MEQVTVLSIITQGEGCWPDLIQNGKPRFIKGNLTAIARLPDGMNSGKSSVTLRIELADGRIVLAETSLRLLDEATNAFLVADILDMEKKKDEAAGGKI